MSAKVNVKGRLFPTMLSRDLAGLTLSHRLGTGYSRDVFQYELDPTLVVKIETDAGSFHNVREADVWEAVKETEFAEWFAPVVAISPNGLILLQKKCEPARGRPLPTKVPAFFTDIHSNNWGFYEGRPVCFDYGHHLLLEKGLTKRMRKVKWE